MCAISCSPSLGKVLSSAPPPYLPAPFELPPPPRLSTNKEGGSDTGAQHSFRKNPRHRHTISPISLLYIFARAIQRKLWPHVPTAWQHVAQRGSVCMYAVSGGARNTGDVCPKIPISPAAGLPTYLHRIPAIFFHYSNISVRPTNTQAARVGCHCVAAGMGKIRLLSLSLSPLFPPHFLPLYECTS